MSHDLAAVMKRGQYIDKSEHLDFEMLVPHRELHHALVKSGFAEKRLGMSVDQIENFSPTLHDFGLERTHLKTLLLRFGLSKAERCCFGPQNNFAEHTVILPPVFEEGGESSS